MKKGQIAQRAQQCFWGCGLLGFLEFVHIFLVQALPQLPLFLKSIYKGWEGLLEK